VKDVPVKGKKSIDVEGNKTDYILAPTGCPWCESSDIESGDTDYSDCWFYAKVSCLGCEKSWYENYQLMSIEECE
jgi:hypothetical protein